jgi:hypothetical protein
MSIVAFTGSRLLPSRAVPGGLVSQVVASALRSGRLVATGCASGADSAVISTVLAQGAAASLRIHCAFSAEQPEHPALPPFHGSWRFSGIPAIRQAIRAGALVHWRAGAPSADGTWGGTHTLVARLRRRSQHMVNSLWSGRACGSGLVAFVATPPPRPVRVGTSWSPCGSGTWSTVALAAGLGLPVVVFPIQAGAGVLPAWPGGSWRPAGTGVWARGWRWVAA